MANGRALRSEVRSPTRTSTEVRSPTRTSTEAETTGNVTVTGGAGDGNTTVTLNRMRNGGKGRVVRGRARMHPSYAKIVARTSAKQRRAWRRPRSNPMHPTAHERAEFSRAAGAMYKRGANANGHLLSAVAAKSVVPTAQYDRAVEVYRAWLVFDEPKGTNPMRRRYRRNPENGHGGGGSMLPLLVGGAVLYFLASRPGGLSSIFPTLGGTGAMTPLTNPAGALVNGVYYPPGVPIPTFGQQVGTAATTAGITAGISAIGAGLSQALRSWFTGPSASTLNTGGGTSSDAVATSVNPNPSPGLWIGPTSVDAGPVVGTLYDDVAGDDALAYARALAQQSFEDAAASGQFVSDVRAYSEGWEGV